MSGNAEGRAGNANRICRLARFLHLFPRFLVVTDYSSFTLHSAVVLAYLLTSIRFTLSG